MLPSEEVNGDVMGEEYKVEFCSNEALHIHQSPTILTSSGPNVNTAAHKLSCRSRQNTLPITNIIHCNRTTFEKPPQ